MNPATQLREMAVLTTYLEVLHRNLMLTARAIVQLDKKMKRLEQQVAEMSARPGRKVAVGISKPPRVPATARTKSRRTPTASELN
jgi:hypothetical protein